MEKGKHIQQMLLVLFLFFFIFFAWKGQKAKSEPVSLAAPIEIVIPQAIEISLSQTKTEIKQQNINQYLSLNLKSNTPWLAQIKVYSNLQEQPNYPSFLFGQANQDNNQQINPLVINQPLSWSDQGKAEIAVIYQITPQL